MAKSTPTPASSTTAGTTLEAKKRPAQQRATETYERILDATSKILTEVGIERLSTNQVCARAGLTPPALYRYFPNKFALLSVLGQRLLERQNACIAQWITPQVLTGTALDLETALSGLILNTYEVTRETEGGMWTLKALRAVPVLEHVRLDSHRRMAREQVDAMMLLFPHVERETLDAAIRLTVEMIHATVEMLFDENMDAAKVSAMMAAMIASQLERIR
ncbi:TetR/AcrR family transcriptional regulator [Pseudomonas fuscovaginae UPB0736]|uniref:Transcriptional regulator, TetR family n=1 Tax=Pseudomonas asplenii TaxID=53407 RepID=A0A1H1XCA7_9PSED|nr:MULTISPECIES: TetR/AcrR family transcriptional regulator [Pseudomonas]UUQ64478.1 TetR/AcrR family transcriptional regulator [Pseudomonas fuscovaginae UPB0736]SDT06907.1 transcriptional regulator, TetR family [Pseudomonas asplenii]SEI21902.1 transcriptional regulator, TetR family [Pseudomonas fuscovaginae]